jgi:hypothetical protein
MISREAVNTSFIVFSLTWPGFQLTIYHIWENQGFQYFSSLPVLHFLQVVLFIKIWTFFMYILYNSLENQEVPKSILNR